MDVTEEMRRAVYAADCAEEGHVLSVRQAISNDPDVHPERHTPTIRAEDPEQVPHISCQRCRKVWLVIEESGDSYEDAVAKAQRRLKDPADLRAGRRTSLGLGPK